MATRLVLRRDRRRRLEQGHPWIYRSEVERVDGSLQPGDLVDIVNHQGAFLARGYANPASQIFARVLTYRQDEPIDVDFFRRRFRQAAEYRERFAPQALQYGRAVYGEADFVPGLVVDRFGDVLVAQVLTAGMERLFDDALQALVDVYKPRGVLARNDVPVRALEGLPLVVQTAYGEVPDVVDVIDNGLAFQVDLRQGQKTGYFWDQTENRAAIRPLMTGWTKRRALFGASSDGGDGARVLDCFCHTGAFAVHALHYGASHVKAVDISADAVALAQANARRNGVADRAEFIVANAFDFLREEDAKGARYDVVILDPPAFAKSRSTIERAAKGYKEINLRAMRILRDGGFLVTASCSYHMSPDRFRETVLDAAVDAHKVLRVVRDARAASDHPQNAGAPEQHYLKFLIYEVRSRR
ncbi:class I SAM-dependent rRNA methyltransferase [Alicyclobacillus vulcanalis]|uniref:23S rRNA (Cytosine1962-C5)-methyltransferase n=1 Tax=Alicyclobacillus vulcanalis TaxID=252246 RepID=A0A1N7MUC0_9BACL|nr:class I SAM-dependent rRNA methyltransferase [Alicyclobacillus vulcanalis]SIS89744.1 23S rRNA (cytosine1962-C5)-methyltransferase [Alicyclobacillus vulcanalis]